LNIGISDLPVDVIKIAEELGLTVNVTALDEGVSGLLIKQNLDGETANIFANRAESPKRRRFTIAHEIGHYVLSHEFDSTGIHVDRGIHAIPRRSKLSKAEPKEVEANQFAAALLMPAQLVQDAVDELGLPLFEYQVTDLADRFEVSEQAMTIRLGTLGIL
jgi:Zn-dependent peptidase ImmA (M78 family)